MTTEDPQAASATPLVPSYADIEAADSQYSGFPPFSTWTGTVSVDEEEWQRHLVRLQEARASTSDEAVRRAVQFAVRAAALDSGAIEGLYEVDRGFTFAVAAETATWQMEMEERGGQIRDLFDAHLRAYELVLDAATRNMPITEAFIRRIHEVLCEPQQSFRVLTPQGWQDQKLPKGRYKGQPNHPFTTTGAVHAYAPVSATPAEMHSLVEQLASDGFADAPPVVQAAFAHYSLAAIHPFADGNGRVARALASVYLYRAASIPLVIYADQRDRYLDALREADVGQLQLYGEFIYHRAIAAVDRVAQLLVIGGLPPADESIARLRRLSFAMGGLTHGEIDQIATQLTDQFAGQFTGYFNGLGLPGNVRFSVTKTQWGDQPPESKPLSYRRPINPASPNGFTVSVQTTAPADASVGRGYQILVATSERTFGTFLLARRRDKGDEVEPTNMEIPLADAHPEFSPELIARIGEYVTAEGQLMLSQVSNLAERSLRTKGY